MISPNRGEAVTSGATYTIQWEAPSEMIKFMLRYSVNNGRAWKKIAKKVKGTSYNWKLPIVKKSMKNCLIQVIGFDEFSKKSSKDASDSTFTIVK